jgi:hypothetical protein
MGKEQSNMLPPKDFNSTRMESNEFEVDEIPVKVIKNSDCNNDQ